VALNVGEYLAIMDIAIKVNVNAHLVGVEKHAISISNAKESNAHMDLVPPVFVFAIKVGVENYVLNLQIDNVENYSAVMVIVIKENATVINTGPVLLATLILDVKVLTAITEAVQKVLVHVIIIGKENIAINGMIIYVKTNHVLMVIVIKANATVINGGLERNVMLILDVKT